jgi:hypothetical protein
MITVYNVIYAKPVWTKATAITHLTENGVSDILQCEETDGALCFTLTIKNKDDLKPSRALPLTDSVCLIIRDLNIPDEVIVDPEERKEELEEKTDVSLSERADSC